MAINVAEKYKHGPPGEIQLLEKLEIRHLSPCLPVSDTFVAFWRPAPAGSRAEEGGDEHQTSKMRRKAEEKRRKRKMTRRDQPMAGEEKRRGASFIFSRLGSDLALRVARCVSVRCAVRSSKHRSTQLGERLKHEAAT